MKMYIKESYVYSLPLGSGKQADQEYRWVACNGEGCGYERSLFDSNYGFPNLIFLRMYKVNGVQICERCLEEWKDNILEALEGEEE